ncbi:hypothetical protein GCM10023193_45100 [Planotetraspora kaengkrachanensis]|uniref:Uncharacterized protein n=1 Tax=Planotetraspora kaengkrachanensis TaxID=575193 RepID=A0A8J3Q0C7_9ACTN|nr:hypothetical protein Pka01_73400 [Planotetraspora kaengkrachanensis]
MFALRAGVSDRAGAPATGRTSHTPDLVYALGEVLNRGPRFPRTSVFLSTMPDSFAKGQVGTFIRRRFPRPCRYEKNGRP